ncbi:Zinc finger, C2H2 [Lasallia pustulata]|uniref:Zinc finger, C2H2 n=1 Tax=Lasallia pustulata TaxID=136370 RepID=A0A1W5D789_9LECA|nr:Zinc finger, C2H2 [Lasallia pustulata]
MPKAEIGSTKFLNNKLKSKGLQRLRWYCQVCERQMRDENGFKCHTQSESHVRQMLLIGEDSRKHISDYSNQFQHDFLQLLRTSHGEKKISILHFYQEYISNKEHVHMNATRWPSLTEYAKHLGREGLCRVEETDKGLHVSWIDNSPEALRRQDAIRKKERQDKGDEEREQKLIQEQIERAKRDADEKAKEDEHEGLRALQREEGKKIKLSFAPKVTAEKRIEKPPEDPLSPPAQPMGDDNAVKGDAEEEGSNAETPSSTTVGGPAQKVSLNMGGVNKPKNVFAMSKRNALGGSKSGAKALPKKKMSEAERIMKEEIERKRSREAHGFRPGLNSKRQKVS